MIGAGTIPYFRSCGFSYFGRIRIFLSRVISGAGIISMVGFGFGQSRIVLTMHGRGGGAVPPSVVFCSLHKNLLDFLKFFVSDAPVKKNPKLYICIVGYHNRVKRLR